MKHFKFLALMLVMISSACFFASCSDDDNDKNENKTENPTTTCFLVGTWKYQFDKNGYVMWTFKDDGSGSYYEWDHDGIDGSDTFTYTLDEEHERIAFYFSDGEREVVKYSKKSNTRITVYDFFDDVEDWVKQK